MTIFAMFRHTTLMFWLCVCVVLGVLVVAGSQRPVTASAPAPDALEVEPPALLVTIPKVASLIDAAAGDAAAVFADVAATADALSGPAAGQVAAAARTSAADPGPARTDLRRDAITRVVDALLTYAQEGPR